MRSFFGNDLGAWDAELVDIAMASEGALTYSELKAMPVDELIAVASRVHKILKGRERETKKRK